MSSEPTGQAVTLLTYLPNHEERARKRLLSQHQSKPRIVALAEAMGAGAQLLEDTLFDVLLTGSLEAANGVTLDMIGRVVGEVRGPLEDEDFRRFINARILVNVCKGSIDELLAIWALVTAPSSVRYLTMYPGGYTLQAVRKTWLTEPSRRRIRRMMQDARPAGITTEYIEALEGYFGFYGGTGKGYGVGKLARVL